MVSVMGEHGFDLKPGVWKLPAEIDSETRDEAAARASMIEIVQMRTAETDGIRRWLIALGNAVAASSALTETDVQAKVGVLIGLLDDYPAGVFTKASLRRAAQRFKFFPAFAELAKLLDEEARDLSAKRDRLLAVAKAQPAAPKAEAPTEPIAPATDEQKAAVRDMLAAAGVPLVEPEPVKTGSAAPGELKRVPGSDRDREEPVDTREAVRRVAESAGTFRRVPKPWERTATSSHGGAE